MAGTITPDFPEMPDDFRRAMQALDRAMEPHRRAMASIVASIDTGALADLRRTSEKIQRSLPTGDLLAPQTMRVLEDFRAQHAKMLKNLAPLVDVDTTVRVLEPVRATATAHSPTVTTTSDNTARRSTGLTAPQLAAAATLLAGLHSYLMDLREADLADAGTFLIVLAALIAVTALLSDQE